MGRRFEISPDAVLIEPAHLQELPVRRGAERTRTAESVLRTDSARKSPESPSYSHPIDRQTALVTLETLAYELQAVANATQRQVMWSDLDLALTRAIKRLLEVPAR